MLKKLFPKKKLKKIKLEKGMKRFFREASEELQRLSRRVPVKVTRR